jgi:hypothetical protein
LERSWVKRRTQRRFEALDGAPIPLGDRRKPLAKNSNRARKHPLARREEIGNGGFERAGSRAAQQHDFTLRTEDRFQRSRDSCEELSELRPTMIDHGPRQRFDDWLRNRNGSGKE